MIESPDTNELRKFPIDKYLFNVHNKDTKYLMLFRKHFIKFHDYFTIIFQEPRFSLKVTKFAIWSRGPHP